MPDTLDQFFARLDADTQTRLRNTVQAGELMQALLTDAEAARAVIPLVDKVAKKKNPAHVTTEEIAAPIVERALAQVDAKLAERDKKSADERASADLAARMEHYRANESFTDEGIAGVLAIMKDKGVADFDIAAREYRREHPAPAAATPGVSPDRMDWNVMGEMQRGSEKSFFFPDGGPSIAENPEAWERQTALDYLNNRVALPA